jgi:predicted metal-dependent phosphoesterase TrpH
MKCDLHVHSTHSGMCDVPFFSRICRECYSPAPQVYDRLKHLGMDLVTITDHDSVGAIEELGHHPDFFLSEEVTCRLPSGTLVHIGVYNITPRQQIQIQSRRNDLISLLMYLTERQIFFAVNHVFSSLTGSRRAEDFDWFEDYFPAFETLNAHMLPSNNLQASRLAARLRRIGTGGSDAHTLASAGSAYTEVPGATNAQEFLTGLRSGQGRVHGESGTYWKCTRDVLTIARELVREKHWTVLLSPLFLLVPAATLAQHVRDIRFLHRWAGRDARPAVPVFGAIQSSEFPLEA